MFGEEEFGQERCSVIASLKKVCYLRLLSGVEATWKVRYLAKRGDEHARKTALLKSKLNTDRNCVLIRKEIL